MPSRIISKFFPGMNKIETRKFGLLGLMLALILGSYWLLRLLKNTIIFTVAFTPALGWDRLDARHFQTDLKFMSPWVILAIVMLYSKFVGKVKRQYILTTLWGVYALLFAVLAVFFLIEETCGGFWGKTSMAIMGFSSYLVIESFGALAVVLFWSFANSITATESAKKGFPLILTLAHLGSLFFSSVLHLGPSIGIWPLFLTASIAIITAIIILKKFVKDIPKTKLPISDHTQENIEKEGFFKGFVGGFTQIIKNPYLVGVLIISTFYEVISQVIDFQMNSIADDLFENNKNLFMHFEATYGMAVNLLTILISLVGISFILRRFGTRISLMIFPIAAAIIFTTLYIYSYLGEQTNEMGLLILFTTAMVLTRGIAYAVNNPTKEIMWIPTSKEIKFRSKGWIDSFAARILKSKAAVLNRTTIGAQMDPFVYGTCFAIILIWSIAAVAVGKKNQRLVQENKIIE